MRNLYKSIERCWVRVLFVFCCFLPINSAGSGLSFVVGINDYVNLPKHQQLTRSENDAKAVFKGLTELGFSGSRNLNLTRSLFNAKWQEFLEQVQEGDNVTLFFSGHGVEIEGQNYLLPSDIPHIKYGRQEQLKRESISVSDLLLDLRRRQPKVMLLIIDACRDNPMIPPEFKSIAKNGGLAKIEPPEGTFIMYSAAVSETALDRLPGYDPSENSVYTRLLLPFLRKSSMPLPELARALRREVQKLAKSVNHVQRPAYYDGLVGEYCLGGCSDTSSTLASPVVEGSSTSNRAVIRSVKQGQQALNLLGYYVGSVDGVMGPRTRQALASFQKRNGLSVNGVFDVATLRALVKHDVVPAPFGMPSSRDNSGITGKLSTSKPAPKNSGVVPAESKTYGNRYVDNNGCLREADGRFVFGFRSDCK